MFKNYYTTVTYWNYYKTIAIIQLLLLLLKLLFKNFIWIECGGLTFEKASDNAVRTDQLIK